MDNKLKKLKRKKLLSSILLVCLVVSVVGLTSILLGGSKNIKIERLVSKVSSLNASVIDADTDVNAAASYDEITYNFNVTKEASDEAIVIGTLTDSEAKYARFKETSNSVVTNNGKTITVRTTSSKIKVTLIVSNAPYGEVFDPSFTINSEDQSKSSIQTEPVTIMTSSIEGKVLTEEGVSIGGLELSVSNSSGEVKRTYSDSEGNYVFSLPTEDEYYVELKEEKYKVVRQEELTTNENKKIINIIVRETNPFKLELEKTIYRVDLIIDGKAESYDYDNLNKIVKNIKKAKTIEGSIYYKIKLKNVGEETGTLSTLKDILHEGLSFSESRNPGWVLKNDNLYYTVLEGTDIESYETKEANLTLTIDKTDQAKNYLNEAIGKGETFKDVVYILNNNIYKEEYVISGEKIENIIPSVDNFKGWYTDRNYTNKYDFSKDVDKNIILYGKIEDKKYDVTFIDKNPFNDDEIIIETKQIPEGELIEFPSSIPEHNGFEFECWTLNDSCIETEEVRSDLTIFTKYNTIEYDITYELDGGTLEEDNPSTYNIKSEFLLNNPNKQGYTFLGWTSEDITEPDPAVTITRGTTGDKHFVANFEIRKSSLSVDPNGGTYLDNSSVVSYTEDYGTVKTIVDSVRKGYTFKKYLKTGGGIFVGNTFTFDTEDAWLIAQYDINNYTISYDNITEEERVSLDNPVEYNVETETFTLKNPDTRVDIYGYNSEDFLGWDDGSGNVSNIVTIEKGSIGNRTYTAVWKINEDEYDIVYNYNGGNLPEGKINPRKYKRTTETFTLENPVRDGYSFDGWTWEGHNTPEKTVTIETGSFGNKSYTANYTPITYTISYDGLTEDEITTLNNPVEYNIESNTIRLNNPSNRKDEQGYDKYDFLGWDDGQGNVSIEVIIPTGSTGDKTYTAKWKDNEDEYSITYYLNGGSYSEGEDNPSTYQRKTPTFTLVNPSKEGYTFTGWTWEGHDTPETTVTIEKGSTGNRAFTANYTLITYTISYDGLTEDEITTLNNPINYNIETATFTLANPSTRLDEQGLPKENFIGWDDGSGNLSLQIIVPVGSTGNKEYTAVWVENENIYGITYILNGGTYPEGQTNPNIYTRQTATFTLVNPGKEGYIFTGWTWEGQDAPVETVTIPKGSAGDRTFTANYTPITYTITYIMNGGSVEGTNPVNYTIESNELSLINPTKEGYTFTGWSGTGIEGKSKSVTIPHGSIGDREYTANFEVDTYNITYVLDGGSASNPSTYTIETNTFTLNNPTKKGYTFTGWSGTDIEGTSMEVTIPKGSTGNKEFTAHYSLDTYRITYDYDGGSLPEGVVNPESYTVLSDTITFNRPSKTGYTFKHYMDDNGTIITEIPAGSTGDIKLTAKYDIDRFNIYYYNGEELFASEIVDYNNTATKPIEDPVKAHNIFLYWSEDGITPFDFEETLIIEDKSLYAVYEEVVEPTITLDPSLDPSTNKTWVCENNNDSNCGVEVTITPASNDYQTYYKIGNGEYTLYTEPFKVYDNGTVSAFSAKSNINSLETNSTINNIDKINPIIIENSFTTKVAAFSITLTGKIKDNESGIKYYELYIMDPSETLDDEDIPYMTSDDYPGNNEDVDIDFRFTGLETLTTYKMYVKAFDYVGHSEIYSIEATTSDYVARIIGRANTIYDDESQWEKYESLQDAIDDCGNIQCTIQLNPSTVNESVEINEFQDVTLDIDNKILTSSNDYTVKVNENGKFTLVDNSIDHAGMITNNYSKGVINNGTFTLGEGSYEQSQTLIVPNTYPVVEGAVIGLDNYGTFYFYDGYVKATEGDGHSSHVDNTKAETITQYPYNVITTKDNDKLVSSLKKVDDPEARIKSVYYTKLSATGEDSAINSSNNGYYEEEEVRLLSQIKQYGDYGFIYNPNEDSIINSSAYSYGSEAISYVKVDLTKYTEPQYLLFNTSCDTLTGDYGYIAVSETFGDLSNKKLTISGNDNSSYRIIKLDPGKVQYIYFGFVKNSANRNTKTYFKVNSASIVNTNTKITDFELIRNDDNYYFIKQNDGSYVNNNDYASGIGNSQANSYAVFDLTNMDEDLEVVIDYDINADVNGSNRFGFINITDNDIALPSSDTSHRVLNAIGINNDQLSIIKLTHGQKNYVHFGYYKNSNSSGWTHTFKINSIRFEKLGSTDDVTEDNIHYNIDDYQTPSVNEADQYYFEYKGINPFVWKDSTGNGFDAKLYGPQLSENRTYYSFNGTNYGQIDMTNLSLDNYEESVYLEYSTTMSNRNMVMYGGSNKEKISIGFYNTYIIVSSGVSTNVYQKPSDYADGNIHSLLVTYKDGSYELYYDGELLQKTGNRDYWNNNQYSYIGVNRGSEYYFDGNIYQLRIYNKQIAYEDVSSEENLLINYNPLVQEDSNFYVSNNNRLISGNGSTNAFANTTAHSYLVYDLSSVNKDIYLKINYSIESENNRDWGYIIVNNTPDRPSTTDTVGRYLRVTNLAYEQDVVVKLKKNQVNYLHFMYSKDNSRDVGLDSFIINSIIPYEDKSDAELSDASSINTSNTSQSIFNLPIARLNEDPSVVVMLKDVTVNASIEIPEEKEIVLDLNGYNLSSSVNDYLINNKGNLTITDGKYTDEIVDFHEQYEAEIIANQDKQDHYYADLAEYQEYAGLCDGCEPSAEYIIDHAANSEYSYTGDYQTFTAQFSGTYELEVWGAQGGYRSNTNNGGKGGYSKGKIELEAGDTLYVYVGGSGNTGGPNGGFNGGGSKTTYPGGGGATDIRIEGNTLYNRIIVAGGGGSDGAANYPGKAGGGLEGISATETSYCTGGEGGTQTTAGTRGSFGQGGSGGYNSAGSGGGGFGGAGGGGWYGGGGVNPDRSDDDRGGGGGSGFIYDGTNVVPEDYAVTSHVLTNAITLDGTSTEIPTYDGTSTMTGNSGDGYAKITMIESEEYEEAKENLPKHYNVKEEPIPDYLDYSDGKIHIPLTNNHIGTSTSSDSNISKIEDNKITLSSVARDSFVAAYYKTPLSHNIITGKVKQYTYNGTGTIYVGFATTPNASINDFVSYKAIDVVTNNNAEVTFTVENNTDNELYFKIVANNTRWNDPVVAIVSDLYFDTFDAKTNYSSLMGNITNGSYSIFLNNTGATLDIEDANISINKASASAIVNRGNLSIGEMVTINANAGSSKAIDNETTGNIESFLGKINTIGDNSIGLHNRSLDNRIDNINVETTKSNQVAIYNGNDGTNVEYNNITTSGPGLAFQNFNNGDTVINNSTLLTTGSNPILLERDTGIYRFDVNSSNIYGLVNVNASQRNVTFNNCNFFSNVGNISNREATVTVNNSYLESMSATYQIYNAGKLYVNDSYAVGQVRNVYNFGGNNQETSFAKITNSTFKLNTDTDYYSIENFGTLEMIDTLIDTDYGARQTAIQNRANAYLLIDGSSSISEKYNVAINNEGFLRLGNSKPTYDNVYNFDFTGSIQEFTVPETGNYRIEAWGAQGGYRSLGDGSQYLGGNGAYTAGDIQLNAGEKLYIYVGSEGLYRIPYDYYGMPWSSHLLTPVYNSGGIFSGGATDISISGEENTQYFDKGYGNNNNGSIRSLRSESSYLDRIMVAGGGAEKYGYPDDTSVGQALGNPAGTVSQTTGYAFGYGQDKFTDNSSSSGGSGYFGGSSEQGGTSYISGYLGSVAMDGSSSNPKCTMSEAANDITCSYHNSGKIFTNTVMLAGNEEMPTHDGLGTTRGNYGHGFVKITYLNGEITPDTVTNEPSINASNVAINGKGTVEYLDGTVKAITPFNSDIKTIPDNYDLDGTTENNKTTISLKSKDAEPYVAQIGNDKYTTLGNALENANSGDEIVIIADIYEGKSFEINKDITINYNGHFIYTYNTDYLFINNDHLKLYDSTNSPVSSRIDGEGLVYNNGDLEIDNIIISDGISAGKLIYNKSTISINKLTVTVNSHDYKTTSQFIYNEETGNINITNSTLKAMQSGYQSSGIFIDNYGTIQIKDSTYQHTNKSVGMMNNSTGNLIIDNVTMTRGGGSEILIQNYNECTVKNSNTLTYILNSNGTLTLEGNTFKDGGVVTNESTGLLHIKSGNYTNTFNIGGSGYGIDESDNLYSFIMDEGTINKTLNLTCTGLKWIKSGSIIPNSNNAINNTTASKLILGIKDGNVDPKESTKPIITGNTYAIYTSNYDFVIDFYDGILTGEIATDALFEDTEVGYQIHKDYDIDNNKEIEYLKQEVIFKNTSNDENYYSTNEVNDAISNGTFNSGDTLQLVTDAVIVESEDPITVPSGFTINFDLNGHQIEQDDDELFINDGTLVIDDSRYQNNNSDNYGKVVSKRGEVVNNNGTLTINAGEFVGEKQSSNSTVIMNNGTLTINDGTFIKHYDDVGYTLLASGSIIENNGTATILGGIYKVPSSYVETYYQIFGASNDYILDGVVYKNNSTGILNVSGGSYPVTTDSTYANRNSTYRTDYYYINSGQLIENYGTATISDITSNNSHIGYNEGTLTLDNVTMDKIVYTNSAGHPNLLNRGSITIIDSTFQTHSAFINNYGDLNITNTTIDKIDDNAQYYYYSYVRDVYTNLYYNTDYDRSSWKNSFVIRNNSKLVELCADEGGTCTITEPTRVCYGTKDFYYCKNFTSSFTCNNRQFDNIDTKPGQSKQCYIGVDNNAVITNSTIYNKGSGEVIFNQGTLGIDGSTIESTTANNGINNNYQLNVYGNSSVTSSNAIGINNANTGILDLGKPAIEDGAVSKTEPLITGQTYGISNSGVFNFYDGLIRGKTKATNGSLTSNEVGYTFMNPSSAVDGYNVAYLDQIPVIKNLSTNEQYYTIDEAVYNASSGDTLQMISNANVLNTANVAVIDKTLTLDLNGYTINQGNNVLFRNESKFTINDSSNSNGQIDVVAGSMMIDNFGDLEINGGTYNTSSGRLVIKNEALTTEEINNNVPEHTVTLQNNARIIATDNTTVIENRGIVNIYNGAYIKNKYVYPPTSAIQNYNVLNVVDLNKDDDNNTSSNLTAPWIYCEGLVDRYSSCIRNNNSSSTLNIYGGIFNNGGTYDQGSITPDVVSIFYNAGTVNIKNLDNYSFALGRNDSLLNITDSHFYNMEYNGLDSSRGTTNITNTIFETTETDPNRYGADYEIYANNATFNNVTIKKKDGITTGKAIITFSGNSVMNGGSITTTNSNNKSLGNTGTLTMDGVSININNPFINTGTLTLNNSTLTSSSNGFNNQGTLNILRNSNITSTNGIGINNTTSGATINLGINDGVVDITIPLIEGTSFGIDNSVTGGKLNLYDGLIKGVGGPNAINGPITGAEGGYIPEYISSSASDDGKYQVRLKDGSSTVTVIAKVGNQSFTSQNDPYVTETQALQLAITTAYNAGRGVDLVRDITIDENISAPSSVVVYRNGNHETIASGVTVTNVTFTDGQAPTTSSLARFAANVLGMGNEDNNIVIYELNDGSVLDTTLTYKLYLNGNLVKLEEDGVGIYNYKGNDEELRPIRGKIYINNLLSGDYRLVSSDNKSLDFSIDDDGNITGNVKKYNKSLIDDSSVTAASIAELILAFQTGVTRHNYLFIIPIIILILIILLCIKRKKKISE